MFPGLDDLEEDDWRLLTLHLNHLHQLLLVGAEALRAALESPQDVSTVEGDVQGYLMRKEAVALTVAERTTLRADLEVDIAVLQRLTKTLAELRTLVAEACGQASPEDEPSGHPPTTR